MLHLEKPLLLYGRTLDGQPGVHVFAALTAPGKPSLLIDRGFIPTPPDAAAATAAGLPGVTVDGIVRPVTGKAWFEMDNVPDRDRWFWIDPPAMARAAGAPGAVAAYLEAFEPTDSSSNGPVPTGGRLLGSIRNQHRDYAITWFSLAAMLAGTYIVWLRRAIRMRP